MYVGPLGFRVSEVGSKVCLQFPGEVVFCCCYGRSKKSTVCVLWISYFTGNEVKSI